MEVKISFDTQKDSVEELKKLVANLQDLIAQRENRQQAKAEQNPAEQHSYSQAEPSFSNRSKKTDGGCQVIPYQDMTATMESIFSGKK